MGDDVVELRPKAAELLELLARAGPSRVVTRDEIRQRLWPTTVIDYDTGINTCVRQLRDALGDPADAPRFIQTIPRRGYRFLVQAFDEPEMSAAVRVSGEPVAPAVGPTVPRRHSLPFIAALVVALVAAGSALGWRMTSGHSRPVIAIGAFETRGTMAEDRLAERLADGLIAALEPSHDSSISVRRWIPGMRYDSAGGRVEYQGEPTDVRFLVSGFVLEERGIVEISVRLRDVPTGTVWWSRQYVRVADPDTAATDIAHEAATAVRQAVSPVSGAATAPGLRRGT